MANIHPFFSGIDINGAADWTIQFMDYYVVPATAGLSPKPPIIISEGHIVYLLDLTPVGWPSQGGSVNSSVAGISQLQQFINTFVQAAKNADVTYYWFEGYDEPWKIKYDTATEQYEDHWVRPIHRLGMTDVAGLIRCKWVFKERNYIAEFRVMGFWDT